MKKIALVLGSLVILTILGQNVFAEESCPKHSTSVELEYNIQGGIVNSICMDRDVVVLLLNIEASSDGQLVIEIPRMIMDVAMDCTKDDRFYVLIDGMEKEEKKFSDPIKHVLTIDFSKESSTIEIIGLMVSLGLTDTEKKLCIEERLQKYPPRQQLEFGISDTDVICKDDLQLIFKSTDGSPACVKPETKTKLIERGWAVSEAEPESEVIQETDFDSNKYYEEFGPGSPLVYKETTKPVLDYDNCKRYAYWLTEHQKEKIDLYEDYPRYPPWGNQIFPLVDYCLENGDLLKFKVDGQIQWSFKKATLNKMTLWEDPFFTDPDKFVEISEKKDSQCFTTPSMNYFCYAKPIIYEDGPKTSYVIGENGISGELHFDSINEGEFYFTIKNMIRIQGDTASITFADKDYRVGNTTSTMYEITDEFEFSAIIEKFDTFIAKCNNYEGTSVTIVQYLGITTIDDVDYFMTWHTIAESESGVACDYPQIIKYSIGHDFGL